ncbi:MAG TPA: carbohydrate ABC transporter permease [Planctomycetota bacterium]|nr:carbohydrate ABC transporter permease [Planctomycetota bacterium]
MTGRVLRQSVLYLVLAAFVVVALYPVFWMFTCGLKTRTEVSRDKWGLPDAWHWENFHEVLYKHRFWRYVVNSVIVTVSAVLLTVVAASLAGFAFARTRFRGRSLLFYVFLAGMMIPVHIVLIPLLKIFGSLHLADTRSALVMSYVAFSLPVSIFILRGFFEGVPTELEEAARIDGCSAAGVFWHVMLPLARPAVAVVVIFNFVTLWNEFIFALTLINTKALATIPLGMWEFSTEYGRDVPLTCAALSISILPMLLVYVFAQKHIIRGLTSGALRG